MKYEGTIASLGQTRRSVPTKYLRANKTLHATSLRYTQSGVEMNRVRFPIFQRGLGGFSSNGRIYDPITAQFMQADNYIQSPEDYIDYNRYAYCRYNPFKYTDPSGEGRLTTPPEPLVIGAWIGQVQSGVDYESSLGGSFYYPKDPFNWGNNGPSAGQNQSMNTGTGNGGGYNNSGSSQGSNGTTDPANTGPHYAGTGLPTQTKTKNANEYVAPLIIGGSLILTAGEWSAVGELLLGFTGAGLITGLIFIPSSNRIPEPYEAKKDFKRGDKINLKDFSQKIKNKTAWKNPKTGEWIEQDTGHHGQKTLEQWKLYDKFGKKLGTIDGTGRWFKK